MTTDRAVVLARGLGTRMRAPDASARLTFEQQRAADTGVKAMIPLNGRPFLDYILTSLADAGIRRVALIVAPDHDALRRYYDAVAPPSRVVLDFIVQRDALGTADAVLAAERWTAGESFLTMNADNLYPVPALSRLATLPQPGLPAFDPADLVRSGNIPADRIRSFAVLDIDAQGYLTGIIEKPGDEGRNAGRYVSMNCWRFDARIFRACREVPRSKRGEFELPEAVGLAITQRVVFKTFPAQGPVLDLSTRADAADVAARLAGVTPRP
jgi:glucose-1-phosphate thymidylyltransferase